MASQAQSANRRTFRILHASGGSKFLEPRILDNSARHGASVPAQTQQYCSHCGCR